MTKATPYFTIHSLEQLLEKYPLKVTLLREGDYGERFLSIAEDISLSEQRDIMIDMITLKPDECSLQKDGSIRIWWD